MNIFLEKFTQQAINYAIRSGLTVTGGFAIRECSRLLQSTPRSGGKSDLVELQSRLESKIRIISPAIDMIELIAARGNTSLESAVSLTKSIRWDIQALGVRLANAANEEELLSRQSSRAKSREQNEEELKLIVAEVRKLLFTIEDAVPLINLAITTSGVKLTTNLPATISPSRLLQASTFLTAADSCYATSPAHAVQVGPTYTLSMYMLFAGHTKRPHDDANVRETTWKEVIHKARVKLLRTPLNRLYDIPQAPVVASHDGSPDQSIPAENRASEFGYQLLFVEDLDDGRVHTQEDDDEDNGIGSSFDDETPLAGIRDVVPIHQISKIFYADTGKILDIGGEGEVNSPVLLLRRDIHAVPPRRMMAQQHTEGFESDHMQTNSHSRHQSVDPGAGGPSPHRVRNPWSLPRNLDPEWIALEVYREEVDSDDDESDTVATSDTVLSKSSATQYHSESNLARRLAGLALDETTNRPTNPQNTPRIAQAPITSSTTPVKTSLSSLEMLIRLTALQQFKQSSHLTIEDELLNFFLEDSANTGAGTDAERRQRLRHEARRRVGFDPFDESPIKRRGEAYQSHARATPDPSSSSRHRAFELYDSIDRGDGGYFDDVARYSDPVRSSVDWLSRARPDSSSLDDDQMRSSPTPAVDTGRALPAHLLPSAPRVQVTSSEQDSEGSDPGRSVQDRTRSASRRQKKTRALPGKSPSPLSQVDASSQQESPTL